MDKLSSSVKNKKTTLKIKGALALWLLISSQPVPGEEGLPVAFITDLLAALGEECVWKASLQIFSIYKG